MGRQDINNLESGLVVRQKINQMFIELYALIGSGGGGGGDAYSVKTNVASQFVPLDEKTSVGSNDLLLIEDSDDSFNKKTVKISSISPITTPPNKGFFVGGLRSSPSTYATKIDSVIFSDLTSVQILYTLYNNYARKALSGFNSSIKGYSSGGYNSFKAYNSVIDYVSFHDEVYGVSETILSVPRSFHCAVNSSDVAVNGNGSIAGGICTLSLDGVNFSDESNYTPAATLNVKRQTGTSFNSSENGFWVGGSGSGAVEQYVDKFNFSDETTSLSANNLVRRIYNIGSGVNSEDNGYFGGGTDIVTGSVLSTIYYVNFSDETNGAITETLSQIKRYTSGANNSEIGIFAGGYNNVGTILSEMDVITFSDESVSTPYAILSEEKREHASYQSGGFI